MNDVHRLVLTLFVALLAFGASGAVGMLVPEPCAALDTCAGDDETCLPTCVSCGCCAQAVEPVALAVPDVPDLASPDIPGAGPRPTLTASLDILHVPRAVEPGQFPS
jgi:hypothetical protein